MTNPTFSDTFEHHKATVNGVRLPSDAEALEEYARALSAGGLGGSIGFYREVFTSSEQVREAAKEKPTIPVLALGGGDGGMGEMPLADMRRVAGDVRGGAIGRCGHFIAEERPEYLVEQLLTFFGEEERRGAEGRDGPREAATTEAS